LAVGHERDPRRCRVRVAAEYLDVLVATGSCPLGGLGERAARHLILGRLGAEQHHRHRSP
jgi:hypothetical protein